MTADAIEPESESLTYYVSKSESRPEPLPSRPLAEPKRIQVSGKPISLKRTSALSPSLGVRKLKLLNQGLILILMSSIRKMLLLQCQDISLCTHEFSPKPTRL